jgi:hypothetical protein
MLGYLEAINQGASVIIDTDDDNIPRTGWQFPEFDGQFEAIAQDGMFLNIYRYFSRQRIWPRGFPLQNVLSSFDDPWIIKESANRKVGIWQGLADDDPDVDAIYRLTVGESCIFENKPPIVLENENCTPYNSQNTATRKELFPLLYLPAFVTFRFTDILRGLIAQPFMWANGYSLGFCAAGVYQERNFHDLLKDFESEIPCYLKPYDVLGACQRAANESGDDVCKYLTASYKNLVEVGIVPAAELRLINHWVEFFNK